MKVNRTAPVPSAEITPEHIYLNRRKFMQSAGLAATAAVLAACAPQQPEPTPSADIKVIEEVNKESYVDKTDELGDALNTNEQIINYNNYYEFSFGKEEVATAAKDFPTSPWEVKVGGLVNKPRTFGMEDILKQFPSEERIYRLRCVEAWSMVIPWMGFPLGDLIKAVEPLGSAKYVAFTTVLDEVNMPNLAPLYPWPYTEGLRLDEAMHDLTILVTGLYGKPIPPQNGAPLRLAVPWKYGFKVLSLLFRSTWLKRCPKLYGRQLHQMSMVFTPM